MGLVEMKTELRGHLCKVKLIVVTSIVVFFFAIFTFRVAIWVHWCFLTEPSWFSLFTSITGIATFYLLMTIVGVGVISIVWNWDGDGD